MPECPPVARLQQLLDGELSHDIATAMEGHIEACAGCQRVLDRLTQDPLADRIRPPADASPVPSALATTFLLRVRAADRPPSPPAGPPEIPGYKLVREIGRGGMGVVYQAVDTRLNRPAAVKTLRDATLANTETRVRFMIEAEAVARLRHPGIVQVYEFGEANGLPFLAMEYVPGGTLADHLSAGHTFAPADAAELVAQLAIAVAAAHRAGVIHRDLKPANLLVADGPEVAAGATGIALKVADFGLARMDGGGATATGEVMGTPSYMSPEQAAGRGREVDTRTDVYALGSILYELLSGRPPFTGDTALDVLQQVIHTAPTSFRSLGRRVPRDLEVICRKCLEKEPARRYTSADALAADLRAFRDGRPIIARPASLWEHARRFSRRHPLPAAAVLIVAVAVVVAFISVNDARLRQRQAREEANNEARAARAAQRAEAEARRESERREARIAFDRAVLRCEVGNPVGGAVDLDEAAVSATNAGDDVLAAIARVNAAAWRAELPRLVRRYDAPPAARPLVAVAFAESRQRVVVAGGKDGAVHTWPTDPDPADPPRRLVVSPSGANKPVNLVPLDSNRLFAAFASGQVMRFDPASGTTEPKMLVENPLPSLDHFAVGPDGRQMASSSLRGLIQVRDAASGALIVPALFHLPVTNTRGTPQPVAGKPAKPVTALAFADNGQFLLAAAQSGGILMWGLPSGTLLHQFDVGADVFRLAVGDRGQYFLAGGETATSLWSIHYRDRPLWTHRHPRRAGAVAFSSDGKTCATGDHAGNVACLDRATGRVLARIRLDEPVRGLAFRQVKSPGPNNEGEPDKTQLLVGGESGVTELWELPRPDGIERASPLASDSMPWSTVPVGSESRRTISAVGFWGDTGDVWTLSPGGLDHWAAKPDGGREKRLLPPANDTRGLRTAAVRPDGKLALTGGWEPVRTGVWDLDGGTPTFTRLAEAGSPLAIGFVSGSTFYTLSAASVPAGWLRLWEWAGRKPRPLGTDWARDLDVRAVAPEATGRWLLVGGPPSLPTGIRDSRTGEILRALPHPIAVTAAAVHPLGKLVATGGRDGSVRVWDPTDGSRIWQTFSHTDAVTQVIFGTDELDGTVLTASHDRTVRVWHAGTGLPLGPPLRHPEAVLALAANASGRVLTGGKDGILRQWQLRVGVIPR